MFCQGCILYQHNYFTFYAKKRFLSAVEITCISVASSKFLALNSLIPNLGTIIFCASDWTAASAKKPEHSSEHIGGSYTLRGYMLLNKHIFVFFTIWSQDLKKLKLSFSSNKEVYASKEVKENALASEGKSCRPGTKTKPQKINMPAMTSQCKTSG